MSPESIGPLLWTFGVSFILHQITADTSAIKPFTKADDIARNSSFARNTAIPRRLPSPWRHSKFPILPPQLKSGGRKTTSTTTKATTKKPSPTTTTSQASSIFSSTSQEDNRKDIIDASSSDHNPRSVIWPVRQRPFAAKRFRAPTPTTPTPQVLLKLRQPKPTRPAIYSLDGFVPKPSMKKISTTEPPHLYSRNDLQLSPSIARGRKVNRFSKEVDNDDYHESYSSARRKKPVSRYTAFARKGVPGEDYPILGAIPQTDFECSAENGPGMFADPYTNCQVWHMCPGGNFAPRHSFLCPNGTIFNQKKRICDWWYNVDCSRKRSRNIRSPVILFELKDDEMH